MKKPKITKKRLILGAMTVIIVAAIAYAWFGPQKPPEYEYITTQKNDLLQEVSVTGRVKASQSVDLAFENIGKINQVNVAVGDKVTAGQILAALNNSELSAQLAQSQAAIESAIADKDAAIASLENIKSEEKQLLSALESEQARLEELKRGTRPEEIKIAETQIENGKKNLSDAESDIENTKEKADQDLKKLLQNSKDIISSAIVINEKILNQNLQDILAPSSANYNQKCILRLSSNIDENLLRTACFEMTRKTETLKSSSEKFSTEPTQKDTIDSLTATKEHFLLMRSFLTDVLSAVNTASSVSGDSLAITGEKLTTLKNYVTLSQTDTEAIITQITNQIETIKNQEIANKTAIATAQNKINEAENALKSAEDELNLKKAGTPKEQITAQTAKVNQAQAKLESHATQIKQAQAGISGKNAQIKRAQADAQNVQARISKTVLTSPINGTITKQDAKVGEIVSANSSLVSIISESDFSIEANVPEADIAKIKVGNKAILTLDAYGDDIKFPSTVTMIDPGETIIEGVTTYKITLAFDEKDERVKPSMTANIDIRTDKRKGVIVIPQRAVISKNGSKIARILTAPTAPLEEREIKTGMIGQDGLIEITEGLIEEEKVVTFVKE